MSRIYACLPSPDVRTARPTGCTAMFLLLLVGLLTTPQLRAQILQASGGYASFFSDAPLEDIQAENDAVSGVLIPASGSTKIRVPIRSFEFPNKLMQEHFNENYMESEKYPYGEFKGVVRMQEVDLDKPGAYTSQASGKLTIHGVTREVQAPVTLTVGKQGLQGETTFVIKLEDHQIDVPKMMFQKIAEEIEVTVRLDFQPRN